jgi:hypothetical protein
LKNFDIKLSAAIRYVDERTLDLGTERLKSQLNYLGFDEENIIFVREGDFRETFIASLERANFEFDWHLIVDADILPFDNAVKNLLNFTCSVSNDVCVIQPHVSDKMMLTNRPAGVHLYKTSDIPEILKVAKSMPNSLRPETHALNAYRKISNKCFINVPVLFGMHDYEQKYSDIYRKAFQHGIKHKTYGQALLKEWLILGEKDYDYQIIIKGYIEGYFSQKNTCISSEDQDLYENFKKLKIMEKQPLNIKNFEYETDSSQIKRFRHGYRSCFEFPHVKLINSKETFKYYLIQVFIKIGFLSFVCQMIKTYFANRYWRN